jgi:hypothetical protein
MSYGLLVKNTAGAIQIDATYKNYSLYEHGENVITSSSGSPVSYYVATITFANASSYPPLIAIKPSSSNYCGLSYYTKSGSNYTGFVVHSYFNTAVTFDWMAFVPNETISSSTYGIRVYNDTGVLVFDGGYAPMVILDVDTATPAYNAVQTLTHLSDANAYFIMAPWGIWIIVGGNVLRRFYAMIKYVSATELSFGGLLAGEVNGLPGSYSGGYWPSTWTILTVKKVF